MAALGYGNVALLDGGVSAWKAGGFRVYSGVPPRDRGQNREEAMREYLTWEINLVRDMAMDDDHRFRVIAD